MLSPERLPPGQREVRKGPRLDLGIVPRFDPKSWGLRGGRGAGRPLRGTSAQPLALPKASVTSDFHCVTGWTTFDNAWEGVTVKGLAERAGRKESAGSGSP